MHIHLRFRIRCMNYFAVPLCKRSHLKVSFQGAQTTLLGRGCAISSPLWSVMFKGRLREQWWLHTESLWEPPLSSAVSWHLSTMHRHIDSFHLLFQWFPYRYYSSDFPVESFSLVCTLFFPLWLSDMTSHLFAWQILFYVRENRYCIKMSGFFYGLNNCPIWVWQPHTQKYDTFVTYFMLH